MLIQDFQDYSWKGKYQGYSFDQLFEKVYHRKESVCSSGNTPSWVWWKIVRHDGWGESMVQLSGRLPQHSEERFYEITDIVEHDGTYSIAFPDMRGSIYQGELIDQMMIQNGLSYGQEVLSRIIPDRHLNEWVYVNPVNYLDIPFTIVNPLYNPTKSIRVQ